MAGTLLFTAKYEGSRDTNAATDGDDGDPGMSMASPIRRERFATMAVGSHATLALDMHQIEVQERRFSAPRTMALAQA
jgi:hypothetical protein